MEEKDNTKIVNIQSEILFVGALYSNPNLFINYADFMKSKYDFADEATKFFYENFEIFYKMNSDESVTESKLNMFMSQNEERFRLYKSYKGWKTVSEYIRLADVNDVDKYFKMVKKYSLLREYQRVGYPIDKILKLKNFETFDAQDIYRMIRTRADHINTIVNAGEEAVNLTNKTSEQVEKYLLQPEFGIHFPWQDYDNFFLGMRKEKVLFEGFLSNEGKTRKLVLLAAYITLINHEDFLLMSNEMSEIDLRNCLITTVINNEVFQQLHGVKIKKPEVEIVSGQYRDRNGEIIVRKKNDDGEFIETQEDYIKRIKEDSQEFWDVVKVTNWIDRQDKKGIIYFKDVGKDYSTTQIEFELRKAKMVQKITYYGYDTLKGYNTDDWSAIKQFATKLKEITKELEMSGFAVFQLSDDSVNVEVEDLTSMNIANAKQIKHIADFLTLGKKIKKDDYKKYKYESFEKWGVENYSYEKDLDPNKQYFAIKIDKNRAGSKDKTILLEIDLDYNTWINIGHLIDYKTKKNNKK